MSLSVPHKKPKRPFDASLQLDTYISFSENICCAHMSYSLMLLFNASADPEGGTGGPDPPPGKSQVIWVSIGNKQLDPPLEKVGPPPPPLENGGPPLEP